MEAKRHSDQPNPRKTVAKEVEFVVGWDPTTR